LGVDRLEDLRELDGLAIEVRGVGWASYVDAWLGDLKIQSEVEYVVSM
jgi:hypothetical protein